MHQAATRLHLIAASMHRDTPGHAPDRRDSPNLTSATSSLSQRALAQACGRAEYCPGVEHLRRQQRHTNYGFLYMAQGVGSVFGGPLAALLFQHTGSWMLVFAVVISMDIITGLLAWFVLKPMRQRWLAQAGAQPATGDTELPRLARQPA
jgi:MFS family permease